MFAALSTVEPPIVDREAAVLLDRDKPWYEARLPILDGRFGFGGATADEVLAAMQKFRTEVLPLI
jgi:hypothetical protein